jgi:phage/plasmid-associated DNA primase
MAGTGKSTSLRLVASLLEARDVGYLNNTLQKTFALEGIFDKLMYLALDIDQHFQLDQATFQSMVVGEEVAVLRKYKRPLTVLWHIHGGFAGNKLPPWTDNGGSLSRRLVVIEFIKTVSRCDPNLFEKCLRLKDRFLKVINSAYHDLSRKYRHRGIKEVIPQKFKQSEAQALKELNVLMSFIKDCADIDPERKDKTYIQNFKDFGRAFKNYCKQNSIKNK